LHANATGGNYFLLPVAGFHTSPRRQKKAAQFVSAKQKKRPPNRRPFKLAVRPGRA
jgi:hypothetical protein